MLPGGVLNCLLFDLHLFDALPLVYKFGFFLSSRGVEEVVLLMQILTFVALLRLVLKATL